MSTESMMPFNHLIHCHPLHNAIVIKKKNTQKTNLATINAGENVEKREPSSTVGGNVGWYNHYGEQYGDFVTK